MNNYFEQQFSKTIGLEPAKRILNIITEYLTPRAIIYKSNYCVKINFLKSGLVFSFIKNREMSNLIMYRVRCGNFSIDLKWYKKSKRFESGYTTRLKKFVNNVLNTKNSNIFLTYDLGVTNLYSSLIYRPNDILKTEALLLHTEKSAIPIVVFENWYKELYNIIATTNNLKKAARIYNNYIRNFISTKIYEIIPLTYVFTDYIKENNVDIIMVPSNDYTDQLREFKYKFYNYKLKKEDVELFSRAMYFSQLFFVQRISNYIISREIQNVRIITIDENSTSQHLFGQYLSEPTEQKYKLQFNILGKNIKIHKDIVSTINMIYRFRNDIKDYILGNAKNRYSLIDKECRIMLHPSNLEIKPNILSLINMFQEEFYNVLSINL